MNITHFVENLDRGGLERMVLELVKLQHAQGHRCQVVCLFERGAQAHELDLLGIPVHACGKQAGVDVAALLRARQWVRGHATEVLHTHNAVAHYLAVLAVFGLGIRQVINTRHGMGSQVRARRREWLYRRSMLGTDAVAMVCQAACDQAVARGIVPPRMLRVVPNGISVERFAPASAAMQERLVRRLGLPARTQLIGSVGRLNWAKNQLDLIRAFRYVRDRRADTALVLIGDGELRAPLKQAAIDEGVAAHVYFLGDRDDIGELLQGLDLFVLSSISEGYSLALLEASAAGLPIVATDVGGNREIIRDQGTGRLVAAGDPLLLGEAMLGLLREPRKADALGHAARAWVEQHGSLDAMAQRYAQLYLDARSD